MEPARTPIPSTTLRPDPGAAAWWSVLSALLIAAGIWFVVDTRGGFVAWAVLVGFVAVGGYFLVQLAVPRSVELRLTHDELRARAFGFQTVVGWDEVHLARVTRPMGDPMLELHLRTGGVGGEVRTRLLRILLPVGCDVASLHRFLAQRLGGPGLRPAGRLRPLELDEPRTVRPGD